MIELPPPMTEAQNVVRNAVVIAALSTDAIMGSTAPLLAETHIEFEKRTGHRILERYGMTETNMNTSNPLDGVRKPGTVGFPVGDTEIVVVGDADINSAGVPSAPILPRAITPTRSARCSARARARRFKGSEPAKSPLKARILASALI